MSIKLGKIKIDAMWHPAWEPGKEKEHWWKNWGNPDKV